MNRLRLSGLDDRAGYAATARMQMQLADFGRIDVDQLQQYRLWALISACRNRARQEDLNYDIAGSFELGKFNPGRPGSRSPSTPVQQYN